MKEHHPDDALASPRPDDIDERLYKQFYALFACPLCRHAPMKIAATYYDEFCFAVFDLVCKRCGGLGQYFVGGENMKKTRKELSDARVLAMESLKRNLS